MRKLQVFGSCLASLGDQIIRNFSTTGLRKSWIESGDLTTPAFEYRQQAGGYGNYELQKGNYVDMYENYLSKIPVIQEYLEARGIRQFGEGQAPIPRAEKIATISGAQTFTELYEAIKQSGGLQGSHQFYPASELIGIIEQVRAGKLNIYYITREGGLRSKVEDLIGRRY